MPTIIWLPTACVAPKMVGKPSFREIANLAKIHLSWYANHFLAPSSFHGLKSSVQNRVLAKLPTTFWLSQTSVLFKKVCRILFEAKCQPLFGSLQHVWLRKWWAKPRFSGSANLAKPHLSWSANHFLVPSSFRDLKSSGQNLVLAKLPTTFWLAQASTLSKKVCRILLEAKCQPLFGSP